MRMTFRLNQLINHDSLVDLGSWPMKPMESLIAKLERHSRLDGADRAAIRALECRFRELRPDEDLIRQGEAPTESAIVIDGVAARYHTLTDGGRQYLSFHITGDWPDAQGLFLRRMDHSVCAVGDASFCSIPHESLTKLFRQRPNVGFAIWRETLIDAAIFRAAIVNNSARHGIARLAHFFSEIYVRSEASDLVTEKSCDLPLSQTQLGEALGMSIATISRHLQALRKRKAADLRGGRLVVNDLSRLQALGDFDPDYLYLTVQPRIK